MVRRDSAWLRQQRIQQITKRIALGIAKGVSLSGLTLWIQVNMGLTKPKAQEYIDLICESQEWEIEKGEIKVA